MAAGQQNIAAQQDERTRRALLSRCATCCRIDRETPVDQFCCGCHQPCCASCFSWHQRPQRVSFQGIDSVYWERCSGCDVYVRRLLPALPAPRRSVDGAWVYFLQGADAGPVKIGSANDVEHRIAELQCGYPFDLRLVGLLGPGLRSAERDLHARFDSSRIRGEWFALTLPLLTFLQREAQ